MSTRLLLLALVCLSVSGCAWQSAVLKVGEDTYQVSANASPARGGITGAREMALVSANEKCDALGKKITVTDIKSEYAFPVNGVASVTFTCK
jgi:stage III sporulation protein SpoIIIAA